MISSMHNPKIQWIRSLQSRASERRDTGAFIVEGVRLAEEALQANWEPLLVLYTQEISPRGKEIVEEFIRKHYPVEEVTPPVMKSAAETDTPQGILIVLRISERPLPSNPDFLLILDSLRDPGNVGTILRTAAAAGVQAVLMSPGTADAFSPKVVRAAMGAHFHLPVRSCTWEEIHHFLQNNSDIRIRIYIADSARGVVYTQADFRNPLALIVGGEAEGVGREARQIVDEYVHIPMPGGVESLNAAVAAGLIMFEVVRQRRGN
jgi:TrmH family RNA methyltransferase